MGKHIIRFSRWSGRSLFLAYSRLMTLIFALFCAATGQLPKSNSVRQAEATSTVFKGKALRASDSTALSGIKLYLEDCYSPLYGIYPDYGVIAPVYGMQVPTLLPVLKRDSVVTDANGRFEVAITGSDPMSRIITSAVVTDAKGITVYSSSGCIIIPAGTDSTYTLYLRKTTTAIAKAAPSAAPTRVMTTWQGQELQVTVPEWHGTSGTAAIVNSRGQEIASINLSPDKTFRWDTRTFAKGIYFLRVRDGINRASVRILVK